jgi:uncharacterized protein YecE (DUF72 family)
MNELLVGTSGYVYPHWRKGVFYPPGLRQRDELAGTRAASIPSS